MRWIFCVLLAFGCAAPVEDREESPLRASAPLGVAESLSAELQWAMVESASQWRSAGFTVPSVEIVPDAEATVLEASPGDCPDESAGGCALPHQWIWLIPSRIGVTQCTKLDGVTQCATAGADFVTLHEIGHFLGIDHHLPFGNVMQEGLSVPMPPIELTPADVAALHEALNRAGTSGLE